MYTYAEWMQGERDRQQWVDDFYECGEAYASLIAASPPLEVLHAAIGVENARQAAREKQLRVLHVKCEKGLVADSAVTAALSDYYVTESRRYALWRAFYREAIVELKREEAEAERRAAREAAAVEAKDRMVAAFIDWLRLRPPTKSGASGLALLGGTAEDDALLGETAEDNE
jgi:hypothetical protein